MPGSACDTDGSTLTRESENPAVAGLLPKGVDIDTLAESFDLDRIDGVKRISVIVIKTRNLPGVSICPVDM
jgi:hypothetical protein